MNTASLALLLQTSGGVGKWIYIVLETYQFLGRKDVNLLDFIVDFYFRKDKEREFLDFVAINFPVVFQSVSQQIKRYNNEKVVDFIIENVQSEERLRIVLPLMGVKDVETKIAEKLTVREGRKELRLQATEQFYLEHPDYDETVLPYEGGPTDSEDARDHRRKERERVARNKNRRKLWISNWMKDD